jgi:hypothetical protein
MKFAPRTLAFLAAASIVAPSVAQANPGTPAPSTKYDAAADFGNTNPRGVWSYGKGTLGGEFQAYPTFKTDKVQWWMGSAGWQSVHKNANATQLTLSPGLDLQPGALVMHPGDGTDHRTIIRFTAPADGRYLVDAKWTTIDKQAKRTWSWISTNAASATGTALPSGFRELHSVGMSGFGSIAASKQEVLLKKGEILSFEIGNGGDKFLDDSVKAEIAVTQLPSSATGG